MNLEDLAELIKIVVVALTCPFALPLVIDDEIQESEGD